MRIAGMIGGLLWIVSLAGFGARDLDRARERMETPLGQTLRATSSEEAIRRVVETFRRGWEEHDVEALRRACSPQVVMILVGRRDQGIENVLERLRIESENFPQRQWRLQTLQVRVRGTVAWAQAETHYVQRTAHGTTLAFTGYATFSLERREVPTTRRRAPSEAWWIVQADVNVRPVSTESAEKAPHDLSLEGVWMLESATDLTTGRALPLGGMLLIERSRYAVWMGATDRRPPPRKPVAEYSKRELLELVRDVEGSVGEYRREGDRVHLVPLFSFFPEATGDVRVLEEVRVERDRMSVQWPMRERRLRCFWRRVGLL